MAIQFVQLIGGHGAGWRLNHVRLQAGFSLAAARPFNNLKPLPR